jgi:hypothetical protein
LIGLYGDHLEFSLQRYSSTIIHPQASNEVTAL